MPATFIAASLPPSSQRNWEMGSDSAGAVSELSLINTERSMRKKMHSLLQPNENFNESLSVHTNESIGKLMLPTYLRVPDPEMSGRCHSLRLISTLCTAKFAVNS